MKLTILALVIAAGFGSAIALADAPATAPVGSTGLCRDGTYTSAKTIAGSCSGHKGVKQWFDHPTAAVPEQAGTPATASSVAPPAAEPAAAKVWVNTSSKVYHCSGSKEYGKTEHGEYVSESDAKAKGARAAHGKSCS